MIMNSNSPAFNRVMNFAKILGIFSIVCSHTGINIGGKFIPSSCWEVPIFFFISGYFCSKIDSFNSWQDLIKYTLGKVSKYLGWFYFYNTFYAIITVIIYHITGNYWGNLPNLRNLTFGALSYISFGIAGPIWFLEQLAISFFLFCLIIFALKNIKIKNFLYPTIFSLLAITAILISGDNFEESFGRIKILIRTCISLYLMYHGYLFKNFLEKKYNYNLLNFFFLVILEIFLIYLYPHHDISLSQARLYHNITTLIIPPICIYIILFLAKAITRLIKNQRFLDILGQNTLHIMANHVFSMFIIQFILLLIFKSSLNQAEIMTNMWKIDIFRWLYIIGGIILSVNIGVLLEKLKQIIERKLNKQ